MRLSKFGDVDLYAHRTPTYQTGGYRERHDDIFVFKLDH